MEIASGSSLAPMAHSKGHRVSRTTSLKFELSDEITGLSAQSPLIREMAFSDGLNMLLDYPMHGAHADFCDLVGETGDCCSQLIHCAGLRGQAPALLDG